MSMNDKTVTFLIARTGNDIDRATGPDKDISDQVHRAVLSMQTNKIT